MASGDYQATAQTRAPVSRVRELVYLGEDQLREPTMDEPALRLLHFEAVQLKAWDAVAVLSRAIGRLVRNRNGYACTDFIVGYSIYGGV